MEHPFPKNDSGYPIRVGAVASMLVILPQDLQAQILTYFPEPERSRVERALQRGPSLPSNTELSIKLDVKESRRLHRGQRYAEYLREAFIAYCRSNPEKRAAEMLERIRVPKTVMLSHLSVALEMTRQKAILLGCLPRRLALEVLEDVQHNHADHLESHMDDEVGAPVRLEVVCEFLELDPAAHSLSFVQSLLTELASSSPSQFTRQFKEVYNPDGERALSIYKKAVSKRRKGSRIGRWIRRLFRRGR